MNGTFRMPLDGNEYTSKMIAHAYVPWQNYKAAFSPREALRKGTLFPQLYGAYTPPK